MTGDPMTSEADVELAGNAVRITGGNISLTGGITSLEAPLLRTTARGLALDGDNLIVTWDVRKAQYPDRNRNRPYEEGHLIEIEGQVEVADILLVKFEQVDPPPIRDYGDDDGEYRAPIDDGPDGGDEVPDGRDPASDASALGMGGSGSIFDYDPPPTVVRRRISLFESLEELTALLRRLSSRVDDLENRILELEQI